MKHTKHKMIFFLSMIVLGGCSMSQSSADKNTDTTLSSAEQTEEVSSIVSSIQESENKKHGISSREFGYTFVQAIEKFQETFKDASIETIQLDERDEQFVYLFQGFDTGHDYILTLNAETGEVIRETETTSESADGEAIDVTDILTPREAMEKAIKELKKEGHIEDWNLVRIDNKTVYKFNIQDAIHDEFQKVSIDAHTGEVLDKK